MFTQYCELGSSQQKPHRMARLRRLSFACLPASWSPLIHNSQNGQFLFWLWRLKQFWSIKKRSSPIMSSRRKTILRWVRSVSGGKHPNNSLTRPNLRRHKRTNVWLLNSTRHKFLIPSGGLLDLGTKRCWICWGLVLTGREYPTLAQSSTLKRSQRTSK